MFKILLILIFLVSCTRKYQTYQVIDKKNFQYPGENKPIPKNLLPANAKKEVQSTCEGQWFFMRNAQKINQANLRSLARFTCAGSKYLFNSKITETWWTTLVYSRSCIKLETYCARNQ
jgi:hypothetical protein